MPVAQCRLSLGNVVAPRLVGWYFPGMRGIRSLVGRPNRHVAGDCLVAGSGEFLYCRMARCTASTLMLPSAPTLPAMIHFTVLTATSVQQAPLK